MSEITLKPCPFCGGKASFGNRTYSNDPGKIYYFVHCMNWLCHAHVDGIENGYDSQEAAARAWNCRAVDKDLVQMVERWDKSREYHKGYKQAMLDVVKVFVGELKNGD